MATSLKVVTAFVLLTVVGTCYAQVQISGQSCSDLATELLTAIQQVYSSVPAPPTTQQQYCSPYNWTSVRKRFIGSSNLQHVNTVSFTIPKIIPSTAREVLIHAGVFSGYSNRGPYHDLKIFTQIGTIRYEKWLLIYSWDQDAISTNSDNMWFPMPPNRRLYLTVPAAHGKHAGVRLFAIGYR